MEVSLHEAAAAISLQSIQKEREKSIAKALSIAHRKDGKNIFPSKKRHDNSSCLSANEAEARIFFSDLRWWHTSMAAD